MSINPCSSSSVTKLCDKLSSTTVVVVIVIVMYIYLGDGREGVSRRKREGALGEVAPKTVSICKRGNLYFVLTTT